MALFIAQFLKLWCFAGLLICLLFGIGPGDSAFAWLVIQPLVLLVFWQFSRAFLWLLNGPVR